MNSIYDSSTLRTFRVMGYTKNNVNLTIYDENNIILFDGEISGGDDKNLISIYEFKLPIYTKSVKKLKYKINKGLIYLISLKANYSQVVNSGNPVKGFKAVSEEENVNEFLWTCNGSYKSTQNIIIDGKEIKREIDNDHTGNWVYELSTNQTMEIEYVILPPPLPRLTE